MGWREKAANGISVGGHPFIFSPLITLLIGWLKLGPDKAILGIGTVVVACLLPASIYIHRKVRRHEWSDLDVSRRRDRPHLFAVGILFLLVAVAVLWLTRQSQIFISGCLAAIVLLCFGWLLNRWLKPSMHVGFATLTGVSLLPVNAGVGILTIVFAAVVGWSRVTLHRHTTIEVMVGIALGAGTAWLLVR